MLSELIDRAEGQYGENLPFVVYRKPKADTVVAVFQKDAQLHHIKDFTESGFVFAPFNSSEPKVLLRPDYRLEAKHVYLQGPLKKQTKGDIDLSQKEFHIDLVKKGIAKIHQGEFRKVVLSRKVEVDCDTPPIDLFQKLLTTYDTAFCYLWHHPKAGTWLGATPEILLKAENQQITTMSLAGTQQYSGNNNPQWGAKELEEQELVTKYISGTLKSMVTNQKISERESIRAGILWHLRTKITAKFKKGGLSEIISAMHPTPAVCGMPMAPAKDFILENENYDREYYTGYLGELNLKNEIARPSHRKNQENKAYRTIKSTTTFFVNLRCMQHKSKKAHIYVGGGITKDSTPEMEWEETVAKTNTMFRILAKD